MTRSQAAGTLTAKGRARRCGDGELLVGKATHFYSRIGVAVLKLDAPLRKGDRIHILGQKTDLEQTVEWDGKGEVWMEGPVEEVFEGEWRG